MSRGRDGYSTRPVRIAPSNPRIPTFARAAELLNRRELLIGEVELAQRHIGLAEIFPDLGIGGSSATDRR